MSLSPVEAAAELTTQRAHPALVQPVEVVSDDMVYLSAGEPPRYIRLSPRAWSIVALMDGSRSIEDIARDGGCRVTTVERLLGQLRAQGVLVGTRPQRWHGSDSRHQSLFFLKLTWRDPQFFAAFYGWIRRWLRVPAAYVAEVVVGLGVVSVAVSALSWSTVAPEVSLRYAWLVWPAFFFRSVFHESGHALACVCFGRRVHAVGVGLYYFTPVAFTDVTDIWLLRRRWQRVVVHIAGSIVDLLLLLVTALLALYGPDGALKSGAVYLFVTTCVGTVMTLNPLVASDGYHVLAELLGEEGLRRRALRLLATTAPWRLRVRTRREVLLVGYGTVCIVYTFVMLGLVGHELTHRALHAVAPSVQLPTVAGWLFGGLAAVALWTVLLRRARQQTLA